MFLAEYLGQLKFPSLKKLYIGDKEGTTSTLQGFESLFTSYPLLEKIVLQSPLIGVEVTRGRQDPCEIPPTPDEWKEEEDGVSG